MCRHFIIAKHARAAVTNQFRLRPILAAADDEDIDSILMIRVHSFGPFFSDTWKKKYSLVWLLCYAFFQCLITAYRFQLLP